MAISNVVLAASDQLRQLSRCLETRHGFIEAVAALKANQPASFDGAWGSSCALLAASLQRHLSAPLVVVCPQPDQIDGVVEDIGVFSGDMPLEFAAVEDVQIERLIHDDVFGQRLKV